MTKKAWLYPLAALDALLATLPFYTFDVRPGWLLSVVITEYGHWLVPVPLVLAIIGLRRVRGGLVLAAVHLAAALVFAMPALELFLNAGHWDEQLREAFGGDAIRTPRPSFARLYFGKTNEPSIIRREISFAPELTLDLYPAPAQSPAPWLVVVHGGGWDSGDQRQMPELNSYLARRGISVASVGYRLAPKHPWPAARDDVRQAIAYLKAHAAELNLDPSRWAILGRSAGGQLAAAVAYTALDPTLKGLISLYAPTDMNNAYQWGREDDILGSRPLVRDYMNGAPEARKAEYRAASPLELVSANNPPTLILHGARDPLVWIRHSELLLGLLVLHHVPSTLITVPWGTHGFDYNLHGPGGQALTLAVNAFLSGTLLAEVN